jgi:MoaA/NifB/PqqE/SkfB family radical SAM enzyme
MTIEQAKAYLSVISRYSNHTCFTGGEPLLYHREIVELIGYAKALGLKVCVMTGAGWVTREIDVRRKVKELADAGLSEIGISWDIYHEELCPQERAVTLCQIAVEEGLPVTIRTAVPNNNNPFSYLRAFRNLPVKIQLSSLVRVGRAVNLSPAHFQKYDGPPKGSCSNVLLADIHYDGKVYACCGPSFFSLPHSPLVLGNSKEEPLGVIFERAVNDPILEIISLLGPYGLYLLLEDSEFKSIDAIREKNYTSICDLCLDLTNSTHIISAIRAQLKEPRAQELIHKHLLQPQDCG